MKPLQYSSNGHSPIPQPEWNDQIAANTEPLYQKIQNVVPRIEWDMYAPYVDAINRLKKERNAVILAHNYQNPEIFHCVSDIVGDSLELARKASEVEADVIVQCGVHFMAETSKLLNPQKRVLIPDLKAGCSLSESITPEDVRQLKAKYPNVPVIVYVNTSAEVKAECDCCCTSSNALKIVESFGTDRVLMLPDEYLAANVQKQTDVEIISWNGKCEVHERFTREDITEYRRYNPGIAVLTHPECSSEVVDESDFSGSTSGLIKWIADNKPEKVMLLTECSMASNIAATQPDSQFVQPCNLCPHMKRITIRGIYESLILDRYEITIEPELAQRARKAVDEMLRRC